jgi:hypothetical protein
VLLWLVWRNYGAGRFQRAGLAGVAAALVLYAAIYGALFARMEALALSPRMATAVRLHATCPEPVVASVGYHEPSAVFEIGTDLRLAAPSEAAALLAETDCALVFVADRRRQAFEDALAVEVRRLDSLRGWQLNGGRWTTLTLYTGAEHAG